MAVSQIEDIKHIVLKRSKLTEWVDEHFDWFHETVVGCFVKVAYKGSYKLVLVVDAKEEERETQYVLEKKKKTNIQLSL